MLVLEGEIERQRKIFWLHTSHAKHELLKGNFYGGLGLGVLPKNTMKESIMNS